MEPVFYHFVYLCLQRCPLTTIFNAFRHLVHFREAPRKLTRDLASINKATNMSPQTFMLLNSFLLLGVGIMLGMIGFFFKDLHKDFKELVLRVNSLYTELTRHTTQAEANYKNQSEDLKEFKDRVKALEKKMKSK